jgi:hypothetical protein
MEYDASVAVAMFPKLDDEGQWDGTLSIVLEEAGLDDLDEDSQDSIRIFAGMVATTVEMMNEDPEMMMKVHREYFSKVKEFATAQEQDKIKRYANTGDNVFQLFPNTKTEGSA